MCARQLIVVEKLASWRHDEKMRGKNDFLGKVTDCNFNRKSVEENNTVNNNNILNDMSHNAI